MKSLLIALTSLLLAPSLSALTLKHLDTHNVSDANWCGDFSQVSTYDFYLRSADEELLSGKNVRKVETELRQRFFVYSDSLFPVVEKENKTALQNIGKLLGDDMDYCFRTDFSEVLGYEKQESGAFATLDNRNMTFWQLTFANEDYRLVGLTYFAAFDNDAKKLYLIQIY